MASKIVPGNIDGTYPTAGKDNSSQGFRDNFTSIKNNFTEARSEILALQTGKANLDASSDFANNVVTKAQFKDTSQTVFAHGTTGGSIVLNHANGHYQTMTTNAGFAIGFANMPSFGRLGTIRLDVTYSNTSHVMTLPTAVKLADNITGGDGSSKQITAPTTGRYLYEFVSPDGGVTVLMHQVGKMYN